MWPFRKKEKNKKTTAAVYSDSSADYRKRLHIQQLMTEDFSMTIEDIYTIMGLGTMVVGTVQSGIGRVGEDAVVIQGDQEIETTITKIDRQVKLYNVDNIAYATERAGLALRGIQEKQLHIGDQVVVRNANKYVMQSTCARYQE